jgi:DNA-binding NarL/FixJ family response regulator
MPVPILIVDDHPAVRRAIRSLLTLHNIHVCGEASDGEQALERVRRLRPEVVLLDINMPDMNGIRVAYKIRQIAPSTKILFLTIHTGPGTKYWARILGADAFVSKSAARTELIPALARLLQN